MLQDMKLKNGTKSCIMVHPHYYSAEYPYRQGVNTYTFSRAEFDIDPKLQVRLFGFFVYSSWTSSDCWIFLGDCDLGKYRNATSSSSSGSITNLEYPATSSNKLGIQIDGDTINISIYESTSAIESRLVDLFIVFG